MHGIAEYCFSYLCFDGLLTKWLWQGGDKPYLLSFVNSAHIVDRSIATRHCSPSTGFFFILDGMCSLKLSPSQVRI
jgi:hypothetical protein